MENILKKVKGLSEQAEVFFISDESTGVNFRNGKLQEVSVKKNEGVVLRMGKTAFHIRLIWKTLIY